jgi:hypothetical protein
VLKNRAAHSNAAGVLKVEAVRQASARHATSFLPFLPIKNVKMLTASTSSTNKKSKKFKLAKNS